MEIVIVGGGTVGAEICTQLAGDRHSITVIDRSETALSEIANISDVVGIVGNGISVSVLQKAGVGRADLLIAADCTAYAYGNFHQDFMRGRITLIGCPKLDEGDYTEKLTAIIRDNNIKSVTIVRMEVPCCGGLENAAKRALQSSGKFLPWSVVTISTDGKILE